MKSTLTWSAGYLWDGHAELQKQRDCLLFRKAGVAQNTLSMGMFSNCCLDSILGQKCVRLKVGNGEIFFYNTIFKNRVSFGQKIRKGVLTAHLNRITQTGFCEQGFDRTCAKHICKHRTKLLAFCFLMLPLVSEPMFVNAHT